MAANQTADAQQTMGLIDQLQGMTSTDSQVRCIWDVGARQAGPGGVNGKFKRQCRMAALVGMQPPFCRIHAEKAIIGVVRAKTAKKYWADKKPLARLGKTKGSIDTKNLRLSIPEMQRYIDSKTTCAAVDAKLAGSGVYDPETAICLAMQ